MGAARAASLRTWQAQVPYAAPTMVQIRREPPLKPDDRNILPPRRPATTVLAVIVVAAAIVLAAARPAAAGTIRHDRDPQAYVSLGNDPAFASVGRFDIAKWEP